MELLLNQGSMLPSPRSPCPWRLPPENARRALHPSSAEALGALAYSGLLDRQTSWNWLTVWLLCAVL